jgi:hypothetical protein
MRCTPAANSRSGSSLRAIPGSTDANAQARKAALLLPRLILDGLTRSILGILFPRPAPVANDSRTPVVGER